ncbi:hypothetical protein VCHA38O209_160098 [Vibrio chagasii]|nr:hypothetical protein VCHA38O206_150052 [Vibrio chagasii]CAH7176723.1 hypothetical protein VCHA39O224_130016 [Vibrio chagasii]CAH7234711.1 hypothetical protein VCHA38O209_160098 [Vibrio chagasii]CAH7250562.1 hypothetical protein VCHA41O249_40108 [Vibrio chagasii]CAH7254487.1 hypothetical protein VCHA42P256_40236 [Vibrio chagasii]
MLPVILLFMARYAANHGQFADLVSSLASFYFIKSIFHHFYVNC